MFLWCFQSCLIFQYFLWKLWLNISLSEAIVILGWVHRRRLKMLMIIIFYSCFVHWHYIINLKYHAITDMVVNYAQVNYYIFKIASKLFPIYIGFIFMIWDKITSFFYTLWLLNEINYKKRIFFGLTYCNITNMLEILLFSLGHYKTIILLLAILYSDWSFF